MDANQRELQAARKELLNVNQSIKDLSEQLKWYKKQKRDLETKISSLDESLNKSFAEKNSFSWTEDVKERLENIFNIKSFRGLQETVINCTLSGKDCIYVAATGSGKSLVFQLPALISEGISLVVSPLLSLMEDQVMQLDRLGIPAIVLNSTTSRENSRKASQAMVDPNSLLKLIYVTPEKLAKSQYLMSQIQKMYEAGRFSRLVIDEAHCCSEWGHDFRKDYKQLHIFKREFPDTPILGLTATATPTVISDIKKILGISNCFVFKQSFYRPNLFYEIRVTSNKDSINDIVDLIHSKFMQQSGIIYCLSIKDTEDVASKLQSFGIDCLAYHAQLDTSLRSSIQQKWYANQCKIMVATVAFGLGINKMDVRFVIHYSISKSVENYYQETGRAGRDGKPAHCVCYYRFTDIFRATSITYSEPHGKQHVYEMLSFCLNRQACRKRLIAEHFVDDLKKDPNSTHCCDNCSTQVERVGQRFIEAGDWLKNLLDILRQAERLNEKMTPNKLVEAWLQVKGNKKLRLENVQPPSLSRTECETVVALLLSQGYLEEYFQITPYNVISYIQAGQMGKLFQVGRTAGPQIHCNSFETVPMLDHDIPKPPTKQFRKAHNNHDQQAGSSTTKLGDSPEIIQYKIEEVSNSWATLDCIEID